MLQLIARCTSLEVLHLSGCGLKKHDCDLLAMALDPTREHFANRIRVLDLQKNAIGKEGVKALASVFETNKQLEYIDLSGNAIGIAGAQVLASKLAKNTSVKFLNVFNNKLAFDGAQAFANALESNVTLEYLEIGHNKIKDKGLKAIADALARNAQSRLRVLGARLNYLTEESVIYLLHALKGPAGKDGEVAGVARLARLQVKYNSVFEYGLNQIALAHDELHSPIRVDLLSKLRYVNEERLERSIWIKPSPGDLQAVIDFFENVHNCGIVIDIRERKPWPKKKSDKKSFLIVEFADQNSVNRAIMLMSSGRSQLNGVKMKISKAGTDPFEYNQVTSRELKALTSRTNIARIEQNLDSCVQRPLFVDEPPAKRNLPSAKLGKRKR